MGWPSLVLAQRQGIRRGRVLRHGVVLPADSALLSEIGSVGAVTPVHWWSLPPHDVVVRDALLARQTIGVERASVHPISKRRELNHCGLTLLFNFLVKRSNRLRLSSIRVDQRAVQESAFR